MRLAARILLPALSIGLIAAPADARWRPGSLLMEAIISLADAAGTSPGLEVATASPETVAWLELTPLEDERPPTVLMVAPAADASPRRLALPGLSGTTMVCGGPVEGDAQLAVTCEVRYVVAGEESRPFELARGLASAGRYLLDDLPVAGVRVAVVPAGLTTLRPFLLPLGRRGAGRELRREVMSDEEGRFVLPPLAPGDYLLESILPSGRIHHSETFTLPAPAEARAELGVLDQRLPLTWELGDFDLAGGLAVTVVVTAAGGGPLAGAAIRAHQGTTPREVVLYQAYSDADGRARLAGFELDRAVDLVCQADGYRRLELHFELLPAVVECPLEPLARIRGSVIGFDGRPPAGARLSLLRPPAGDGGGEGGPDDSPYAGRVVATAAPDPRGRFLLESVEAGDYRLLAAAPGHRTEVLPLAVAAGDSLVLDPVFLLPAPEVEGRVIDAETGEPLAGVEIVAVSPPGAARAASDAGGTFAIALPDGPVTLEARLEHYVPARLEVAPAARRSREPLELALERGGYLLAVVWDVERDGPCSGCPLVLHPGRDARLTDGDGEVFYGPLAPGRYRVERPRVRHLGSTVIEQPEAEVRHVRVERGRGALAWFGDRHRRVTVRFNPDPGRGWMLAARSGRRALNLYPEADGSFVVEQEPGERLSLYLSRWVAQTESVMELLQGHLEAVARLDGDGRVTLPLASGVLRAAVVAGGEPVAFARVRLREVHSGAVYARARSDAAGTILLPHVAAGTYGLEVGQRTLKMVRISGGESVDLGTFELTPGSF
ncbi:MAG: carboxypeptidase regulatory-like domain-containing protein [Acidobacteria bacterium]|nr:MAG: carboxypeptidase regulatory-like domain-containing protein [Acidobacteriota bacterium]